MSRREPETDEKAEVFEESEPAIIRWMPVAVPLAAALVLGFALLVWWAVL
jgi:hypothetical protein